MTRLAIAVLIALCVGCVPPGRWVATSDDGQRCFYSCIGQYQGCAGQCNAHYNPDQCIHGCIDARIYCMRACPGLEYVQNVAR